MAAVIIFFMVSELPFVDSGLPQPDWLPVSSWGDRYAAQVLGDHKPRSLVRALSSAVRKIC